MQFLPSIRQELPWVLVESPTRKELEKQKEGSSGFSVADGAGTGFRAGGFQPGLARCGRETALGHPVPARSATASTAEQEPKRGKASANRQYG